MSTPRQGDTAQPPPAVLLQMMTGYWLSQALHTVASLGIADLLANGERSAEDLAAASGANEPALYRVMRALASAGVFSEVKPRQFALSPLADLLRSDVPGSMRSLALLYAEEQYRAWGDLLHSVRTGEPAFEARYGMSYFDYLAAHPDADAVFNDAMTGWSRQVASGVADTYDFSPFTTIVDVGGGYGALLASVLQRTPDARGVLFDLPHVVDGAHVVLQASGVLDRCELVGGDFFAAVPEGGDAYILAQILHDWDDARCITILQRIREAIPPHGRLLIVELVIPPTNEPSFGKWLDVHMLVLLSGRERTINEYAALFEAAGFSLGQVVPTQPGPSVIEAIPA